MIRWGSILLLLFFAFSFSFRSDQSFDQDLGRHIKLGEIISESKEIPKTNLFSYTYPDQPFINHHWLFEYLAYQGNRVIGVEGLLIIKLGLILLSILLILLTIPKNQSLLILPLGYLFLHLLRERVELRPEILSFLFTASTYYILQKFKESKTQLTYLLPVIQLLWINTHIYFPVGFMLQGVFLIEYFWQKRQIKFKQLALITAASILASLANPNFIQGLIYPLTVFGNYGYTIVENQTIWLLESINFQDRNFIFFKIAGLTALTILLFGWLRKNLSISAVLISLLGLGLASMHIRSFPYLALLTFPALTNLIGPLKNSKIWQITLILVAGALIYESTQYLTGDYYRAINSGREPKLEYQDHLKSSANFLIEKNLPDPIFNNFDIGSYIIYSSYPKHRVFVDGRPEAYPADFFQSEYIPSQYTPEKFEELDSKYNFQTIFFSHTDQTPWAKEFLKNIIKNPKWQLVYLDESIIILVKPERAKSLGLESLDLAKLSASNYQYTNYLSYLKIALFLANNGYFESAKDLALASYQLSPQTPIVNQVLVYIAQQTNDQALLFTVENRYHEVQEFWW